jgi:hypothetical protein
MQKKLLTLVVALALTTVALGVASQASAGRGISVSGTYVPVPPFGETTCAPVGSSSFMFRCDTTGLVSQYSGDLVGDAVADFTSLINCKTGRETGHGTETFTGSITGAGSGTLTYIDQFSADVDCTSFLPFNLDINSVAVKGTGDFAGLQGKLHFNDTDYSGTLH